MKRGRVIVALAASAAIHAVVLNLRFHGPVIDREAVTVPRLLDIEAVSATQVVHIVSVTADLPTRGLTVEAPRPALVVRSASLPDTRLSAGPTRTPPVSGETAANPRLWLPARRTGAVPDPLPEARGRVTGRLDAYNDSVAAATEAERRAMEWTGRDRNGGLWGITPDSIHLGRLAIPLRRCWPEPCPDDISYKGPPDRRDEFNRRLRGFREIEQQAARAAIENTFQDRVRAIRARDAKRDTTGTTALP
jgi:hypothetical protein